MLFTPKGVYLSLSFKYGEYSSVGRAPDCGSGGHGFKSHYSPHILLKNACKYCKKQIHLQQLICNISGCGAIGSALALGARGCEFESRHPDQNKREVMSKRLFVMMFFIFFINLYGNNLYLPYAQRWVSNYIQGADKTLCVSESDFWYIKELVSSSLLRAQVTVQSQDSMWQGLQLFKQGWDNLISTRLNPTKQGPHVITHQQKQDVINQFWQAHDAYETACKDYCEIAQRVVHGDALQTQSAKDAVTAMRQEVHVCMIDALADVKKQLEGVYAILLKNADLDNEQTKVLKKKLSIASFLIDYVPNLVMHQFIKADAFYTQLSDESWSIFEKIQLIGNQAWHVIETARAAFYQALLDELERVK